MCGSWMLLMRLVQPFSDTPVDTSRQLLLMDDERCSTAVVNVIRWCVVARALGRAVLRWIVVTYAKNDKVSHALTLTK